MSVRPVVIIGAGLGGAAAALSLSRARPVVVIDPRGPAGGASGVSAGLVHAFTGRRAARAWRATEARHALARFAEASGARIEASGVLRPAGDPTQVRAFRSASEAFPDEARFLEAGAAIERWPDVATPHGALWIPGGGHVDTPALVRGALAEAERRGAETRWGVRLVEWHHADGGIVAETDHGDVRASAIVLCPGAEAPGLPGLEGIPFGRVKGQTVTLGTGLPDGFPAIAGGTYIVPAKTGTLIGATFEHTFESAEPDRPTSLALRERAARLVPALAEASIVAERAGVRLTVPASVSPERLPRLGPVAEGVWLFAGFGSRGLLTAPLLAEALPALLAGTAAPDPALGPSALRSRPG